MEAVPALANQGSKLLVNNELVTICLKRNADSPEDICHYQM